MDRQRLKARRRHRRKVGIRRRVSGTSSRPRLTVYRSLSHIYAQVIDDMSGRTLASASSRDSGLKLDNTGNTQAASAVGKSIAERAKAAGVEKVAFDRGGFAYHGRVKALGDAAREGGLKF